MFQVKKNPAFNPKFLTLIPNSHSGASIFEYHLIFDFPIFQFSSFIFQGRDLDDPYPVPWITSMFNFQNTSKHKTSAFLLPLPGYPLLELWVLTQFPPPHPVSLLFSVPFPYLQPLPPLTFLPLHLSPSLQGPTYPIHSPPPRPPPLPATPTVSLELPDVPPDFSWL